MSRLTLRRAFAAFVALAAAAAGLPAGAADWNQVLGPTQAKIPPARAGLESPVPYFTFRKTTANSRVNWESDLVKGLDQAKRENRPVFVTFRCLPCNACSDFDKGVLEGGTDLDPLLLQFVTVRLTSAKDVDLRILPMAQFQDLDTSWWGWFLSPEGKVYGVFGGRDATGDAGRTSKAALITALKRVLNHHYDPRRESWNLDGPAPALAAAPQAKPNTPVDQPGYDHWLAKGRHKNMVQEAGCIHCHQVQEIFQQTAIDAGQFDKHRDLDIWPLPENVGVTLERDDGLLIKQVTPGSPADKAGLKTGDQLAAAIPATASAAPLGNTVSPIGERRLFSQADFRAALHRLPPAGPARIQLVYTRGGGDVRTADLDLPDGWRKGNNGWRISFSEGVIGAFPGFWAVDGAKFRAKYNIPADAMAITPFFPKGPKVTDADKGPAWAAGLREGEVITAVNGQSPNLINRNWVVWFRMNVDPGQEVKLDVINAKGEKRVVTFTAQ